MRIAAPIDSVDRFNLGFEPRKIRRKTRVPRPISLVRLTRKNRVNFCGAHLSDRFEGQVKIKIAAPIYIGDRFGL